MQKPKFNWGKVEDIREFLDSWIMYVLRRWPAFIKHTHIKYDEYMINNNTYYDDILVRFLSGRFTLQVQHEQQKMVR